jgi:hypothetical protein
MISGGGREGAREGGQKVLSRQKLSKAKRSSEHVHKVYLAMFANKELSISISIVLVQTIDKLWNK